MKRFVYTFYLILLCSYIFAGNGTKNSPYSVKEMKSKKISTTEKYYVEGYIVGEFISNSNNKLFYEMSPTQYGYDATPSFSGGVYIIADNPTEYDINNCLTIQFPNTTYSDYYLDTNPEYWRKKFIFYGSHETYNGVDGMKKIDDFELLNETSQYSYSDWTFYEDFEKGSNTSKKNRPYEYTEFTQFDEVDKWLGGSLNRYYNDGYMYEDMLVRSFQLTNAIVDDGKPKWDDLAVSLRNTSASLELTSDLENGLGEIEFWAGNYDDYSAYKLSFTLQISTDKGKSWTDVVSNISVTPTHNATTNGMSLYRFTVNQSNNCRFKIIKTDSNTGKGLQIDNIKISQYNSPTNIINVSNNIFIISNTNSGLEIKNSDKGNLSIYSITGQQIYNSYISANSIINIPVEQGLYIINFNDKNYKFIKY